MACNHRLRPIGYNPFGRIPKLALQHIAAAALITFQTALPGAHRSAQTLFHRQATQPGWTGCLPHRRHHPGKDLAPFNFFYAQVGAVKGSFVAFFCGETSRVQANSPSVCCWSLDWKHRVCSHGRNSIVYVLSPSAANSLLTNDARAI